MPIPTPNPQEPRRDPRDQFAMLPGPLRAFMEAPEYARDLEALYTKHQLTEDALDAVIDLIGDIDFCYRPFSDLLPALIEEIHLSESIAKAFAIDLAGIHYLPIAELINADVWGAIKSWGGDPAKFQVKTIAARKVTAPVLVDEVLAATPSDLERRLQERLRFVLLSRVQGVRDDRETQELLTRDQKVGGVGISPDRARSVLDVLHEKLAMAQIVAEQSSVFSLQSSEGTTVTNPLPPKPASQPIAPPLPPPKPRPTLSEALPAAQKFAGPNFEIPTSPPQKDEEEIATMRTELAERIPKENNLAARKLNASVENIVRTSGLTLDSALTERFKRIVEARFRDIRDATETKRLLSNPVATGGLALTAEVAERLANLIEAEYRGLMGQSVAEKQREANSLAHARQQASAARETARSAQETQAAEERFHKLAAKSKHLEEREVLLPPVTPSHISAPLTTQSPKSNFEVQLRSPTSKSNPPRPVLKAVLSPASVAPQTANRPKMEDVKVVRTIAGPIDELATMSLVEFRRLSRDPREATLKIRDKIELLKEEGFERYFAAVRAWHSSEPNRAYLALTREALGASSTVPTIIQSRTQTNQPTLTIDEFQAILALNGELQM